MRRLHQTVCYVVLVLGILQFFWIGLGTLSDAPNPGTFPLHVLGGYLATLVALVALVLAAIGRREALAWSAGLVGVLVLQILLVRLSAPVPIIGAFHPVNALVVLFFAATAARGAPMGRGGRTRPGDSSTRAPAGGAAGGERPA